LYGKGRERPSCAEFRIDTEEILRKFLQKLISILRIPYQEKGSVNFAKLGFPPFYL
jgi:hypothetical protein